MIFGHDLIFAERMVERIFLQVNVTRRESEIQLDNKEFDARKERYRRQDWILEGKDPDLMEELYVILHKRNEYVLKNILT